MLEYNFQINVLNGRRTEVEKPRISNTAEACQMSQSCLLWNSSLTRFFVQKTEDAHPQIVAVAENGKPQMVSLNVLDVE